MTPWKRTLTGLLGAGTFATTAGAETHLSMTALDQRISALEAKAPVNPPSGGIDLEFYGYVKADLIYNFGYDLGLTTFSLGSLTEASETGDFFDATARQTRLGVRSNMETAIGEVGLQVEGDFYGEGGTLRLRHATATLGPWRVGKYWTTFMPLASYPVTLDFQGIAGIPFARPDQVRYTHAFGGTYTAEVAIEQSVADSDDPVLIGTLAYQTDPVLLKIAALTGNVNDGTGGTVDSYGLNLSSTLTFGATTIDASYTMGEAINSYMVFPGDDIDATGAAVETRTAYVSVAQSVTDKLTLRAMYGWHENDSGATADSTERLTTVHVNASYDILENTSVGIEYFHGTRDTFGGSAIDVDRVQAAVTYTF